MSGISDAQRAALATLAAVVDPTTYLGGGVAIALRLAHRQSRDLDLFVLAADPVALAPALEHSSRYAPFPARSVLVAAVRQAVLVGVR
jgi:hypothetical protein